MNCLDEGLLQALNDGELSAEARREAEAHLALCPSCATAAEEAAREFALFSQAIAVDGPLNVPTERLRANVASAIAEMQPTQMSGSVAARDSSGGPLRSFWSSLADAIAPRQVAVFASLALVAAVLAATFFALRPGTQPGKDEPREIAKGSGPLPRPTTDASVGVNPPASPAVVDAGPQGGSNNATTGEVAKIRPKVPGETGKFRPKIVSADRGGVEVAARGAKDLLPVERQYAREIAALKTSIERQKLQTLSPTMRAEYERNVAVVDEAIASTRAAVKENPADRDAREFLRAAYQNKLDLLSAVAGKSQLASADR